MKNKPSDTIMTFVKFGSEENIRDLYENGTLYLNSIQFFRKYEDDGLRGDMYEGITDIRNYPAGDFEIKSLNYKGKYISLQVRDAHEFVLGNIYSLYCVTSYHIKSPEKFIIDKKNLEFGTHCLMVHKNEIFLELIKKQLKADGFNYRYGFVRYYNKDKKNGKVSLFHKPKEYKYQNEFRFYVERDSIEPLIIKIGSLKNIAEIYSSEELINGLRLSRKERHSI